MGEKWNISQRKNWDIFLFWKFFNQISQNFYVLLHDGQIYGMSRFLNKNHQTSKNKQNNTKNPSVKFSYQKTGANTMTDTIQSIITERETIEALESRYHNTIKRYRWTSLENIRLSIAEFIGKYISECDKEDAGVYRNHKFYLTEYQEYWLKYLMEKEYKYMITIKLPHYEIDGFKRTKNQEAAVEQIRKLIREIEQEYTGHKH